MQHAGSHLPHAHDPLLVALSVAVALVGSYAAVDLTGQLALARGRDRALWLTGATLALGVAVWAMHFVAMLAYRLPIPIGWDLTVVAVALAVSVAGSGAGLAVASRRLPLGPRALPAGAAFVGFAIVGMHFTGMAAMRVAAVQGYAWGPVALSAAAAVGLSGAGLWVALRAGKPGSPLSGEVARRGGGALLLGSGIVGMHFLAMAGTGFSATVGDPAAAATAGVRGTEVLAWSAGAGALGVSALALLGSLHGRRLDRGLAQLRASEASEAGFRAMFRHAPDVTAVLEADGTVRRASPSVERVLGYPPEELAGTDAFGLVHPEDLGRARACLAEHLPDPDPGSRPVLGFRCRRKDGTWRHVEAVSTNMLANPDVRGLVASLRDVTERALAEERLEESEGRFRALVRNASDIVTVVGADGAILYESPSVERVLGYRPEGLVGRNALDFVHPDDAGRVRRRLGERAGAREGAGRPIGYRIRHADGSWRRVESVANNLLSDPAVGGVVVNTRDVTERVEAEERLARQALRDPLTGLPNRRLLADRLGQALAREGRDAGGSVAVLFVDLDNFKYVNDSLGHGAGDELLVAAAGRLRACLRPADTAARLGGDEFVLVLEGAGEGVAVRVSERAIEELGVPFDLGGREVFATPSIGIALGAPGDTPEDVLRRADIAMYAAKERGKARHAVYEPAMGERSERRLGLENELRRALERGELAVRYQPVVRLRTGEVAGLEALVRWERPGRGLVPPSEFVPLAEETGLIVPIGRWVLGEACRRGRLWQRRHPKDPPLVVGANLSARQLEHPGLVGDVAKILEETGLAPDTLTLEVTESALVEDAEAVIAALREIRALGARFAIDDFGTGYSSLSYLGRLPAGLLKVAGPLVGRIGEEGTEGDEVLLGGVVGIAHGLGLRVCAEGVETIGQLERVRELGCDLAQGFLFSEPLTAEEASELLVEDPRWT